MFSWYGNHRYTLDTFRMTLLNSARSWLVGNSNSFSRSATVLCCRPRPSNRPWNTKVSSCHIAYSCCCHYDMWLCHYLTFDMSRIENNLGLPPLFWSFWQSELSLIWSLRYNVKSYLLTVLHSDGSWLYPITPVLQWLAQDPWWGDSPPCSGHTAPVSSCHTCSGSCQAQHGSYHLHKQINTQYKEQDIFL